MKLEYFSYFCFGILSGVLYEYDYVEMIIFIVIYEFIYYSIFYNIYDFFNSLYLETIYFLSFVFIKEFIGSL